MEPVTPKPDIAPTRPNDMLPSDVHTITPLPYYISSGDQVRAWAQIESHLHTKLRGDLCRSDSLVVRLQGKAN